MVRINYQVFIHDNYMPDEFCDNLIEQIMSLSSSESNFPWYWVQVIPQNVVVLRRKRATAMLMQSMYPLA